MDVADLQRRIDSIRWYHEFDFGNGLHARSETPDIEMHRRLWRFKQEILDRIDFQNKTVLDVGCWDGYWSFYAERRGAKSVLAADDFSQNWSNEQGLLLAREIFGSNIEVRTGTSVYDLASLDRKFDVILMLGVYYHLFDPFYAFAQVRHCCHSGTVVCIEGNESFGLPNDTAALDLNNLGGKFNPSIGYLRQLLQAAYFLITAEQMLEPVKRYTPPPLHRKLRWRLARKALFGSDSAVREMASQLGAPHPGQYNWIRRAFLTCKVLEGENPMHVMPPPFGLSAYDPRFATSDR